MWHGPFLDELRVEHLMTRDVITLSKGQSLPAASEMMRLARIRHLPVVDDEGRLEGLVTHRDLVAAQISSLSHFDQESRSSLLFRVPVASVMHANVWTIASTAQASAAAHMLRDHRFGCLPVVDSGQLVGILTEADFVRLLTTPPGELAPAEATPRVGSVMTRALVTVDVGTTLGDARASMTHHKVRHLPIVNGDEPLGMLSDRDLQVAEAALAHIGGASEVTVGCIGSETPYLVDRDARLDAVLLDMADQRIGSALVVKGGRLVGILTATDACRLLGAELRALFPVPDL